MGTAMIQGQLWGAGASDWAEVQESLSTPLFEAILDETGAGEGSLVLDIGCGSGTFCKMAAKRGAQVSGLDAAESLLSIAHDRVKEGDFRPGEMEELPYQNQTFDIVTGFSCFQFAANPEKALREASRVSRSGAVAFAVFGKRDENESAMFISAVGSFLPSPPPGSPGPYALSADGALEALANIAGMIPGEVVTVDCPWDYPDEKTALRGMLSAGGAIRAMQLAGREAVRDAVLKAIAPFKTASGGYHLTNNFRYMIATAA